MAVPRSSRSTVSFVALALLLALPARAYAYIDPGSGALLWQAAMAGVVGALFLFRKVAMKPVQWIRSWRGRDRPVQRSPLAPTSDD